MSGSGGGGGNTNDDDDGCFAEDSRILSLTKDGEIVLKKIRDVKVGDKVESVDPKSGFVIFTDVCFVQHDDDQNAEKRILNIRFQTGENKEDSLRLTPNHLLYVSKGKGKPSSHPLKNPLLANKVEVGDFLWVRSGQKFQPCPVISITTEENVRIVNPITMNNHIVVNGVHASVHVVDEKLWRFLNAPYRMFFSMHPGICTSRIIKSVNKKFY